MVIQMNKDVKDVVRELVSKGWEYIGQNRHIKMKSPKGFVLTIPVSPRCPHAFKNLRKQIENIDKRQTTIEALEA